MAKEKIEVGEIRPIYNITGFQVCKVAEDNPEDSQWTPVEKVSEAEILSFIYQQGSVTEPKKKAEKPKKVVEEPAPITDEDL